MISVYSTVLFLQRGSCFTYSSTSAAQEHRTYSVHANTPTFIRYRSAPHSAPS